jgi:hypothetical protein
MADDVLSLNGVDGSTGGYLHPALTFDELARAIVAQGDQPDLAELLHLRREPTFGEVYGVDLEDLTQAGWALVAAEDTPPAVLDALEPLRSLRSSQAGALYREFLGKDGISKIDTKRTFLRKHGIGPAAAPRPDQVPYFILLVGGPESISFDVQYQLDAQYAVGRVAFSSADDYRHYADAVVAAEASVSSPTVRLFGPRNRGDRATSLSAGRLIQPLGASLSDAAGSWKVVTTPAEESTKQVLTDALSNPDATLLFTASHGLGYPCGDPQQLANQGALVCQDWPGPLLAPGRVDEGYFFGAADAAGLGEIRTRIMMSFACFGAGTPQQDDYTQSASSSSALIADAPFVAALPQRLLSHPGGGLLGFVGHVERAWGCSFITPGVGGEHQVFLDALRSLIDGWRLGHAMQFFDDRYLAFTGELHDVTDGIRRSGDRADPRELTRLWTETNDARSYVVLGDPAVRLHEQAAGDGSGASGVELDDEEANDGLGDA